MQFTHSQGLCISKNWVFVKGCHLPSPSQSAHSLPHSSSTVLLPSSFSCVSLIFEALSCPDDWTFLSSTTLLLDSALFHPSCLSLWPLFFAAVPPGWVSSSTSPEVKHVPFSPHFFPLSFYGGSLSLMTLLLPASATACAQRSLQVGGGGSGANPSRRVGLSSAGSHPLGRKMLLLQLSSSNETCQEAHPQDENAKRQCALLPSVHHPPLPDCSLPVFYSFRTEWEFVKEGNCLPKLSLANDTMTQEILQH